MAVNRATAPEPDWVEIRRAFEAGGETIPALCARFGVTAAMLRRRREREGWPARSKRRPARAAEAGESSPRVLLVRLTACIAAQIERLEERMAETDGPLGEKDVRALGEAARALDKVEHAAAGQAAKVRAARTDEADDGSDWRALLKKKLDRLHRQGGA